MRRDDSRYNAHGDLFRIQSDVDAECRKAAINWVVERIAELEICSKALFLGIKMLDRLLLVRHIERSHLLLNAVACLNLAAKLENQFCPQLQTYTRLADNQFSDENLVSAELDIMHDLKYRTNSTTPILFVKMFVNSISGDVQLSLTTIFVGLCAMTDPQLAVEGSESVAIAVLIVALHARGLPVSPPELADDFARFGIEKINQIVAAVVRVVGGILSDEVSPIRGMFAAPERAAVAAASFDCPPLVE
jgi:hypothetical protein